MDLTQLAQEDTKTWTQLFTAIYGSYEWLNDLPIHYFTTSLSALNLHDDVRLMGEIVGVEKWGFEALFQRVVRKEWVDEMAKNYLGDKNRFKFFPPVTIALLPCEGDVPLRDYGGKTFTFQPLGTRGKKATLDGLEIDLPFCENDAFPKFGTPAQLKWDRQKFAALAIDGQHRISAIREFIPRQSQTAASRDVPATILVFDTKLPSGRDLIQATREIFIDINRNAKTVDASRLILLDDRNFYNGLTRSLILRSYEDGETPSTVDYSPIEENFTLEIATGVPQELIDTASGKDATDVGKLKSWQFTSAFILNKSLQHFFFENSFKQFEQLLDTSEFKEDSDEEHARKIAETRARLEDDDDDTISDKDDLTFEPQVAKKLVDRAMSRHGSFLLGVFTGFKPYKEHILRFKKEIEAEGGDKLRSILLSEGSLPKNTSIENFDSKTWVDLDEVNRKSFRRRINKLFRPAQWDTSIVWYSVFQRGLLLQPLMLKRCLAEGRGEDYGSREEFAQEFVQGLDLLYEQGLFERGAKISGKPIWEGIVLKLGEKGEPAMDGGDAAAKRCGSMIRLLVATLLSSKKGNFDEFSKGFEKKQGVKGPFSLVRDGFSKIAKVRDAAKGTVRDEMDYKNEAKAQLETILEELGKI
jgi:hypothetical protein